MLFYLLGAAWYQMPDARQAPGANRLPQNDDVAPAIVMVMRNALLKAGPFPVEMTLIAATRAAFTPTPWLSATPLTECLRDP